MTDAEKALDRLAEKIPVEIPYKHDNDGFKDYLTVKVALEDIDAIKADLRDNNEIIDGLRSLNKVLKDKAQGLLKALEKVTDWLELEVFDDDINGDTCTQEERAEHISFVINEAVDAFKSAERGSNSMKRISFFMTTPQFIDGSKDVTRRFGWWNLKPGDRLRAVEKAQGLKKGEKMKVLGVIEVISVRREPLNAITQDDCRREGFPDYTPQMFIDMLCQHYDCSPETLCNRIEFKRVTE